MRVRIDTDRCTGHGRCYALVSELFDADDRGYGFVTAEGDLTEEQVVLARKAAGNCPESAIFVE